MATETKTIKPQESATTRFWNWLTETQIWTSVFRHERPNTDRNRVLVMLSNVFLHLHPVRIRKSGVKLRYTWCMGGLSFFLFLSLTLTGLLLMFYYRPTLEYAYSDIVGLREHVPLGIMREMHRWGAHAMVITVWLHMFRVFMTGSYKPPREFNWNVGVILLVLTLLLSFTGYLLPWDQLAVWAITVGSNMARATPFLGTRARAALWRWGKLIPRATMRFALLGGRSLRRRCCFYVLHVGLPLVIAVLIAVHLAGREAASAGSCNPGPERGTARNYRSTHDFVKTSSISLPIHSSSCCRGPRGAGVEAGAFASVARVWGARLSASFVWRLRANFSSSHCRTTPIAADLPAGVLHLVFDARGGAQRSAHRERGGPDRESRVGQGLGLARPGLHRAHLAHPLLGRAHRLVDSAEGAARAAG
jgi:hypothetical protein